MTDTYQVTAEELRSFIERLERLDAEKRDRDDIAEEAALLEMYMAAIEQ